MLPTFATLQFRFAKKLNGCGLLPHDSCRSFRDARVFLFTFILLIMPSPFRILFVSVLSARLFPMNALGFY